MFITFEGGDGAGKTTQMNRIAAKLQAEGRDVVVTREPGGTELGQLIRQLVLYGGDISPKAEALLYAADRAHHVETEIRPALEDGAIVLCDRYIDSSVAYQGSGRGLGDEIRELSKWATNGLIPDLTILFDLPASIAMRRIGATQDRIESAGFEFHQRIRQAFLRMAHQNPGQWVIVDAREDIDRVTEHTWSVIWPELRGRTPSSMDRGLSGGTRQ